MWSCWSLWQQAQLDPTALQWCWGQDIPSTPLCGVKGQRVGGQNLVPEPDNHCLQNFWITLCIVTVFIQGKPIFPGMELLPHSIILPPPKAEDWTLLLRQLCSSNTSLRMWHNLKRKKLNFYKKEITLDRWDWASLGFRCYIYLSANVLWRKPWRTEQKKTNMISIPVKYLTGRSNTIWSCKWLWKHMCHNNFSSFLGLIFFPLNSEETIHVGSQLLCLSPDWNICPLSSASSLILGSQHFKHTRTHTHTSKSSQ